MLLNMKVVVGGGKSQTELLVVKNLLEQERKLDDMSPFAKPPFFIFENCQEGSNSTKIQSQNVNFILFHLGYRESKYETNALNLDR